MRGLSGRRTDLFWEGACSRWHILTKASRGWRSCWSCWCCFWTGSQASRTRSSRPLPRSAHLNGSSLDSASHHPRPRPPRTYCIPFPLLPLHRRVAGDLLGRSFGSYKHNDVCHVGGLFII